MERQFTGTVIRTTGSWYDVRTDAGETVKCRIRGRLRLKGVRSTNPVVVGDRVVCERDEEDAGVICEVVPRRNYIIRRASNLSKESHIIAANLDRALLVVTLFSPVTAPEFIDRFLVTCEAYRVPVTILLAKADLAAQDPEAVAAFKATYESAGYSVLEFSAFDGTGIEAVRELLKGHTTLLAGNSGVGKSTLAGTGRAGARHPHGRYLRKPSQGPPHHDLLDDVPPFVGRLPDRHARHQGLRTDRHRRCRVVALLPRNDAPGPPMPLLQLHPCPRTGCAVREAVERGEISWQRYESYLKMLDDDDKYRK